MTKSANATPSQGQPTPQIQRGRQGTAAASKGSSPDLITVPKPERTPSKETKPWKASLGLQPVTPDIMEAQQQIADQQISIDLMPTAIEKPLEMTEIKVDVHSESK